MTETLRKLLIGTHNVGKAVEIVNILSGADFHFLNLRDVGVLTPVAEVGSTYEENAILKAEAYARESGLLTLADDSGLEVDALDGAPGVISARYAGRAASDIDRIQLLLSQLSETSDEGRTARFVSVVVLAKPDAGVIRSETGVCEGTIIRTPRGNNGFGYDPIFVPNGFTKTFAELPASTKDVISHRAKSLSAMKEYLKYAISFAS